MLKKIIRKIFPRRAINIGRQNKETRDNWIISELERLKPGLRLLDAGAGEQQYRKYCDHLKYVSQDFCQYDGSGNNAGLQTDKWDYKKIDIVGDITKIDVPNKSFDVILCTEVFEHIPDPVATLKEFHRILKKNGTLLITAPFCSMTHMAPYHYSSGYNKYFYQKWLTDLNFTEIEVSANGDYFHYLAQELHRLPSMVSKYLDKKMNHQNRNRIKSILTNLEKLHNNNNSDELLCFGYHVKAIKK